MAFGPSFSFDQVGNTSDKEGQNKQELRSWFCDSC